MKTINIKGKEYVPVVERVKEFHIQYPTGWIETYIHDSSNDKKVVVVAKVWIDDKRFFCGCSQADYGTGMMGNVALEIAETSAVGRALGFANIGLLDGIATADEMRKVSKPQAQVAKGQKATEEYLAGNAPSLDDEI